MSGKCIDAFSALVSRTEIPKSSDQQPGNTSLALHNLHSTRLQGVHVWRGTEQNARTKYSPIQLQQSETA